jgi:manganese transport protein
VIEKKERFHLHLNMVKRKLFGPGALVAAAFIGPGTLTVCTLSGVEFGYDLLWVLLFAIIATMILQEMAARLGLISQKGLGEAIRSSIKNPVFRAIALTLVFVAIIIGNAAYEMGNVTGAVMGMAHPAYNHLVIGPILIGVIAGGLLWLGNFKIIQTFLVVLVVIMSLVFLTSAVVVTDSISDLFSGFIPTINKENQLMALGLIGTTIVPYNLFLHASSVSNQWSSPNDLWSLRREMIFTIGLGGLISMAVLITAASMEGGLIQNVNEMSLQLEPLLGKFAPIFMSVGLFAAGISSALTAPLAAGLTAKGIFGWTSNDYWKERLVSMGIVLIGVALSLIGIKPLFAIQIAQIANGILLPIIAIFLLWICNSSQLMGNHKNTLLQNTLGLIVVLVTLVISFRSFNAVFQFIQ